MQTYWACAVLAMKGGAQILAGSQLFSIGSHNGLRFGASWRCLELCSLNMEQHGDENDVMKKVRRTLNKV